MPFIRLKNTRCFLMSSHTDLDFEFYLKENTLHQKALLCLLRIDKGSRCVLIYLHTFNNPDVICVVRHALNIPNTC